MTHTNLMIETLEHTIYFFECRYEVASAGDDFNYEWKMRDSKERIEALTKVLDALKSEPQYIPVASQILWAEDKNEQTIRALYAKVSPPLILSKAEQLMWAATEEAFLNYPRPATFERWPDED